MTANGEVQTREEATVYVEQLDLFVTVMLLEGTPAVLSLGKLCEDHGYTYYWTSCQKPHLTKKRKRIDCKYFKLCALRSPWFINEFLHNPHTYFSNIFITRFRIWCQQIHRKSSTRKKWKYEWGATGKPAAWTNRNRKHKSKWRTRRSTDRCHRISERIWSMKVVLQSHGETLSVDIETLPVFSWITNEVASKSGTGFV